MARIRFTGTIGKRGINPFITISSAHAAKLRRGWRKPMPVLVRINSAPVEPWRINLMPRGDGGFHLYLHSQLRAASGTAVGDRVVVEVRFDSSYRGGPQHPMPSWFRSPLSEVPMAQRHWNELTPSRKKEIIRYLVQLKSIDARARNVERALRVLSGERSRFMARLWNA